MLAAKIAVVQNLNSDTLRRRDEYHALPDRTICVSKSADYIKHFEGKPYGITYGYYIQGIGCSEQDFEGRIRLLTSRQTTAMIHVEFFVWKSQPHCKITLQN